MKNSKNLPERIKILLSYLNQNLSGKEKVIGLTLLSVIAGENILFLGSSKSEKRTISRRVASAFRDFYKDGKFNFRNARYFECFMTKSSSLDDICGPVNRATMRHLTESYLPSADIAFLDEIWNIHPNVQNTVLKIINDRIYHNGNMVQDVPLLSVIAASKEISFPPAMVFHRFKNNYGTEKNEVLEALRDTFTVRVFVDPISNNDDFFSFLDLADDELIMIPNAEQKAALLSIDEIRLWQQEINKVELSETSKYFISAIRETLSGFNTENTYQGGETYNISDFRWKKIVRLLKTSAFLNGRNTTDLSDLSLIECCIWNTNKQHDETADILAKLYSAPIDDINEQVQAFKERADEKWFKFIEEKPAKDVIVKIDGRPYYECTSNQGQTVYVEKREERKCYCSDGKTRLYLWVYSQNKKNKELMGLFESCNNGFRLVKKEEEKDVFGRYVYSYVFQDYFTKKQTPFIPAHYDKTKLKYYGPKKRKIELEAFDKEEYRPLAELINSEIVKWKQERESVTKQFKSNIFANQENFKIIIEKINTLITKLENRKEELDTLHSLYAG